MTVQRLDQRPAQRLAYDDPDTAQDMARDASRCRTQRDQGAVGRLDPTTRTLGRTRLPLVGVSESAARFAAQMFD